MYDSKKAAESSIEFWEKQPTDSIGTINSFNGTFNISDHRLIPGSLLNYLSEYFYKYEKLNRIPLEKINNALNEIWEGPGSMPKVIRETYELKQKRNFLGDNTSDPLKGYDTPTIESELDASEDVSLWFNWFL